MGASPVCRAQKLKIREAERLTNAQTQKFRAFAGDDLPNENRASLDTRRALMQLMRAPSHAARELLTYPVVFAVGLPEAFTVRFRRGDVTATATSSRRAFEAARARHEPAFVFRELAAAAGAVAAGRASPRDLEEWLAAKRRQPAWVLELARVPGDDADPAQVCFGELFDALGAELVDVVLEPKEPKGKP